MSRVSSATTQQSVPVSSLTENLDTAEVVVPAEKELPQEATSHTAAERQNALTRQSENNLTAMLQKERLTIEGGARAGVDMPLGSRSGAMGGVDSSITTLGAIGGDDLGKGDDGGASGGVIGDRGNGTVDNPVDTLGGARAGVDM